MDLNKAIQTFEFNYNDLISLPVDERTDLIKKKYKVLAKKYHPDKNNGSDEQMSNINNSYSLLLDYFSKSLQPGINILPGNLFSEFQKFSNIGNIHIEVVEIIHGNSFNDIFGNIINKFTTNNIQSDISKLKSINNNLRSFIDIIKTPLDESKIKNKNPPIIQTSEQKIKKVKITVKEFFTQTTKKLKIKKNVKCNCKPEICIECAGSGYNLNDLRQINNLQVCNECLGNSVVQNCEYCKYGIVEQVEYKDLIIDKYGIINSKDLDNYELIIRDSEYPDYYFKENQLYCKVNISKNEALNGSIKPFKDPFGISHNINTNGKRINNLDGYKIIINDYSLILVFFVI